MLDTLKEGKSKQGFGGETFLKGEKILGANALYSFLFCLYFATAAGILFKKILQVLEFEE